MDIKTYLQEKKALVDRALKKYFAPENPLFENMYYSLEDGKRIRPILAIAGFEASGGKDIARIMPVACGLEMIHTYSLIHDDLPSMDNDDFRRGRESAHKKYGEAAAILSGDGLFAYAYELFSEPDDRSREKIAAIRAISEAVGPRGIVYGQMLDIEAEKELNAKALRRIHLNKTAKFICVSIRAGAILARAGDDVLAVLGEAGTYLGVLFQYVDDILDVVGEKSRLGKTPGKDESAGKVTAVRIYGLDGARFRARRYAALAKKKFTCLGPAFAIFSELTDYMLNRSY